MDQGKGGDLGHTARGSAPSRSVVWKTVGLVVLLLVAIGAVIIVVALDPTRLDVNTLDPTLATTAKRGATGFAIALGVFLISLVTVVPYFALSRLRSSVAGAAPALEDEAMSGGRDALVG